MDGPVVILFFSFKDRCQLLITVAKMSKNYGVLGNVMSTLDNSGSNVKELRPAWQCKVIDSSAR